MLSCGPSLRWKQATWSHKAQAMASLARAFVTVAESGELADRVASLEAVAGLEDTRRP